MKLKFFLFPLLCLALMVSGPGASAQEATTPEERERQLQETIDHMIEDMTRSLKLEDWQVFYVDSILNHDYHQSNIELQEMQRQRVSNLDLYYQTQDKWAEQIYQSLQGVLNEDQWTKYLKGGAAREKKARDKRAAK